MQETDFSNSVARATKHRWTMKEKDGVGGRERVSEEVILQLTLGWKRSNPGMGGAAAERP